MNDDLTQYFVDGQWRDLETLSEQIIVKNKAEPVDLKIRFTHRGPLFQHDILKDAGPLFGGTIPKPKYDHYYSHMWGGMYDGNFFLNLLNKFAEGKSVKNVMDWLNENGDGGYRGVPANLIMADNVNGDIGYIMLVAFPNRKDKTPYIGNRVLDGTRTDFDWDGLIPIKQLPQSFNPEKGYIATANNRHMPDNVKTDVGATSMATGRIQRIDEMIRN